MLQAIVRNNLAFGSEPGAFAFSDHSSIPKHYMMKVDTVIHSKSI